MKSFRNFMSNIHESIDAVTLSKNNKERLAQLKVGDNVILSNMASMGGGIARIEKVTRLTKTLIVVGDYRFSFNGYTWESRGTKNLDISPLDKDNVMFIIKLGYVKKDGTKIVSYEDFVGN